MIVKTPGECKGRKNHFGSVYFAVIRTFDMSKSSRVSALKKELRW